MMNIVCGAAIALGFLAGFGWLLPIPAPMETRAWVSDHATDLSIVGLAVVLVATIGLAVATHGAVRRMAAVVPLLVYFGGVRAEWTLVDLANRVTVRINHDRPIAEMSSPFLGVVVERHPEKGSATFKLREDFPGGYHHLIYEARPIGTPAGPAGTYGPHWTWWWGD